ncbi:ERI1 exoribonuclease 2 isoform X2 [Anabrus simplex]|uniref:ERI1 exoribonuclease 2 isoform X2 n=1 Tax=Anabrus simplex TaxID=316456 RepID=UPI0034DCD4BE
MKSIDPRDIRIDITKELAEELGFIETIYVKNTKSNFLSKLNLTTEVQEFDYLIVIDFESTCWKERNVAWKQPEIIEFPAVLLNARTGVVEEEFQQYVMPIENKLLSEFCVKFTGIQQEQVDNGVPLGTCLLLFTNWISRISGERNITFHKADPGKFLCTFVTWSDWDLAMCLHNECQRKNIKKPEILCQWIDLKAVYKEFYQRNPKGLRGALSEVGLNFEGREHSGLSDAKNTAYLAWQMIQHGAKLRITKVLQPVKKISSSTKTSLQVGNIL